MKEQRPILVVGAARSGTTWVGRTVCQCPHFRYVDEPFNKDYPNEDFGVQVEHWLYDVEGGRQRDEIERAYKKLLHKNVLRYAFRDASSPLNWKTPIRFFKHLSHHLLNTERILVKDPLAIMAADWLYEIFGFQVICTIRSPLSFVASMKRAGWGFDAQELIAQPNVIQRKLPTLARQIAIACENKGDIIDQNCLLWNVIHTCIREYQKKYPSWLYVKHEQLALDPEKGFQSIFEFLDLPFTNEIKNYICRYSSVQKEDQVPKTKYRPRDALATLDSWKSILSEDEVARVNDMTGNLEAFFYQVFPETVGVL